MSESAPAGLPSLDLDRIVRAALREGMPWGDITTDALVPPDAPGAGRLTAKARGVLAGMPVAERVFHAVDASVAFRVLKPDGRRVAPGDCLATLSGPAASLLKAERVALNFLQRMSGVATLTAMYVEAVRGTRAHILDTRKTTPGLRLLERYAVRVGGGYNHRFCLSDGVLVKDNHLESLKRRGVGLKQALEQARRAAPHMTRVEVEAQSLAQVREALDAGADVIMLDNMPVPQMVEAVRMVSGEALLEASGGVNLKTVRAVAETGVDLISVGALTHSAPALDISLDLEQ
ncbi:MAG: carboxylating nicotinate-nucleotide diphosphorylase [Dehalococcoidia bacterium]|nr:carboxylating nicotinate-nucleotide diphosphorylase [Dehalococcoidia bacterium]